MTEPHGILGSPAGRRAAFAWLYLCEGAPIGYIWWALPAKLRLAGMPVDQVAALTATLTLPWALKFLWAPLVDTLRSPRWTLRSWIIASQALMVTTLAPLALLPLDTVLHVAVILLLAHAVFAATQDVSIDALAIGTLPVPERGAVNGWMQVGMLAGRATFGGVAIWAEARIGAPLVIWILCAAIASSMGLVLFLEPPPAFARTAAGVRAHLRTFLRTLRRVLSRRATWLALALAVLGGAGYEATAGLASPMLVDHGASRDALGFFFALPAVLCMAAGALLGGKLSDRFGRRRVVGSLIILIAIQIVVLALTLASDNWGTTTALLAALAAIYLFLGAFTASSYALFMDLTDPALGGTQFSAFMGATNLCEFWAVFLAGRLAAEWSYSLAFLAIAAISLLAVPITIALPSSRETEAAAGANGRSRPRR